jgi:cyanuric acid amidohydrolase
MNRTPGRQAVCLTLDMPDPGDASALAAALADGRLPRAGLRAILVKTPGNGLTNDHTRTLALRSIAAVLGPGPAPMLLASGGTEGVALPHLTVLAEAPATAPRRGGGLALGLGAGPRVPAGGHGGLPMARATAAALAAAMQAAGLTTPGAVQLALVKAPLPTPLAFAGTEDAYAALKGRARGAAALGIAAALGEIPWSTVTARPAPALHARRALVAAGTDATAPEVLVLGRGRGWGGRLGLSAGLLADMLDAPGAAGLLAPLGLTAAPQLAPADRARLRGVIVKGEMPAQLRGTRPAVLDDSDIHPNRHFRAALSGMLGGLLGEQRLFLSGGAEHQAPPGGVLFAVIADQGDTP